MNYQHIPGSIGMKGAGIIAGDRTYITHTTLSHTHSAIKTITRGQKLGLLTLFVLFCVGLLFNVLETVVIVMGILTTIYFIDVVFSTYVLLKRLHQETDIMVPDSVLAKLKDGALPIYTILCPMYKEAKILPHFVQSINTLDWPKENLEILLLLEEDDQGTIDAASAMNLPSQFKIVVVPQSFPKTKPKACNYGLSVATGEYVVIYDAEDRPDPLQLKKVYATFKALPKNYGCIQCKLNYFNPHHNLLTRLFTAEYSLWFDVTLPGLQSIEGIIPLGGTSNHFRRTDLLEFEAWDPFNVTEDCELGVRLFKSCTKTATVDSVTSEVANTDG